MMRGNFDRGELKGVPCIISDYVYAIYTASQISKFYISIKHISFL